MPTGGHRGLPLLLRFITDLLFLLNLIALIGLPWLLRAIMSVPGLAEPFDLPLSSYAFYLAFLYASGIGTAWVLLEGHLILRRLEKGEPFAAGQAGSFRRMSGACALLSVSFLVKIIFYNTFLTVFCAAVFLILVLITLIMAEIFQQAYQVKTENELTI